MSDIYTYKNVSSDVPAGAVSPLSGVRVVVQPNISVRGWPCDAGSGALEGFVPLQDAAVITRLKSAGALLAGSSRMSELGFGLVGETTVRALEEGADVAVMTDTMGEARVTAAANGLFGFKPSFGVVSRFGLIGLVPSMECAGLVARDLDTIVDVMTAIAGKDPNDPSMPDEPAVDLASAREGFECPFRAGVVKESMDLLNETEVRSFKAGLARMEAVGAVIQEVSLPGYSLFRTVHNTVASVEASSSAGKYDSVRFGHRAPQGKNWNEMYLASRGESFRSLVKAFLFQGAFFQFEDYGAFEDACRIRNRLVGETMDVFRTVDFLVFPTRRTGHDPWEAASVKAVYESFLLTLPANVTGSPAVQVPACNVDGGVDIGLQVMGKRLDDARLLCAASAIAYTVPGGNAA
ncbi:MAG: amidase family protein [Syntrophorhabdaceae bacterium]|nr:amidase family protein [Syntrophorhabdaceae bacterium]